MKSKRTNWIGALYLLLAPCVASAAEQKPNILWLTGEDMSARSFLHREKNTNEDVDPATTKLAAYHPDIPEMRMDYARYTAGVMDADKALGRILAKLKEDGLADDTIVI